MKKVILVSLCVLFLVSMAYADVYGPYPNYKGIQEVTGTVYIPTTGTWYIVDPLSGEMYKIGNKGGGEYEIHYPLPVFVDSYAETAEGVPFNPDMDQIKLTEIFTFDLLPGLDPNMVPPQRGFNPTDPEIMPVGTPGYFEGHSGTWYQAPIEAWSLFDLPMRLPGYDISKISGPPNGIVYVLQATVPASDFVIKPFKFLFEHLGYFTQADPCWIGPKNPEYPYQHYWQLTITEWSDVNYVSDVDIEQPWTIKPGYIEVVPPENWHDTGVTVGRYGYESNPGSELSAGGGSLGIAWRVNGKVPAVIPGHVVLTYKQLPVSHFMNTMVVASDGNDCGDWGYLSNDIDQDCRVDFADFAYFAQRWLDCTDPKGQDCTYETMVGVGFAFDGSDKIGPATIAFIYDDTTCAGILERNDVILEYRGVPVNSGATLLATILALPDVAVGAPVPMLVLKNGALEPVYCVPAAQEISLISKDGTCADKKCVKSGKGCDCEGSGAICSYTIETQEVPVNPKKPDGPKKTQVRTTCIDGNGNTCDSGWVDCK